jgi:hypothetical protein
MEHNAMMLEELENECREQVKRGFNLLSPEMRSKLDPETLDVELGEDCPLGQAFGNFERGLVILFTQDGVYDGCAALREAARSGFYVPVDAPAYYVRYAMLTRIWRTMLETERTVNDLEVLLRPVGSF